MAIHNGKSGLNSVDCHDFANAKSRNDTLICHTERSEESTPHCHSDSERSEVSKAQDSKTQPCHIERSEISLNSKRDSSPTS